jgi:hypothetical protein
MTIISALIGILLYFFSGRVPHLTPLIFIVAGLGLVPLVFAVTIGASKPLVTAALYKASVLLPLTVGGVIAALVIWVTASILWSKGANPPPSVEALSTAIIAVVGVISDKLKGMDWLRPSSLAARATRWRYQARFPKLYGDDSDEYRQAYEAIHREALSDNKGPIQGWGFDATRRRLSLVRSAL